MKKLHENIGCIHCHSHFSDGGGSYPKIIQAANEAGLDYLLMSDHMTLKGREEGYVGWHDSLFCSVGYEIQDAKDQHHYLAFGLEETLPAGLGHEEYIKIIKEKNAVGIAAHPLEERDSKTSIPGYPPITWTTLDYPEVEVIEIWNMMSHWLEETTIKNKYWNAIHPRSFSTRPKSNLLRWWDIANLQRKVTGVGSVDVHAKKYKILGIFHKVIFDYKVMFKSIRTHLLLDAPLENIEGNDEIEKTIRENLKTGRTFISNHRRGDARGFRFWAELENEQIGMGDSGTGNYAFLKAKLPGEGLCKIIRNGEIFYVEETANLEKKVPEGVYRLEVERKNRGWIYTNHIKIKGKK